MSSATSRLAPELAMVVADWEASRRSLIKDTEGSCIADLHLAQRRELLEEMENRVAREVFQAAASSPSRRGASPSPAAPIPDFSEASTHGSREDTEQPPPTTRGASSASPTMPTLTFKWNVVPRNAFPLLSEEDPQTTRAQKQVQYRDKSSPPAVTSPRRRTPYDTVSTPTPRSSSAGGVIPLSPRANNNSSPAAEPPITWAASPVSTSGTLRWAFSAKKDAASHPSIDVATTWAGTPSRTLLGAGRGDQPIIHLHGTLDDNDESGAEAADGVVLTLEASRTSSRASPPRSIRRTVPVRTESPNARVIRELTGKIAEKSATNIPPHQMAPPSTTPIRKADLAPTPSRRLNPQTPLGGAPSPISHAETILEMSAALDQSCDSVAYPESDTSGAEAVTRSQMAACAPSGSSPSLSTFRDPNSDDRAVLVGKARLLGLASPYRRGSPFRGLPTGKTPFPSDTPDVLDERLPSSIPKERTQVQRRSVGTSPVSEVLVDAKSHSVETREASTSPVPPTSLPPSKLAPVAEVFLYETLRDVASGLEGDDVSVSRTESNILSDEDEFAAADAALEAMRAIMLKTESRHQTTSTSPQRGGIQRGLTSKLPPSSTTVNTSTVDESSAPRSTISLALRREIAAALAAAATSAQQDHHADAVVKADFVPRLQTPSSVVAPVATAPPPIDAFWSPPKVIVRETPTHHHRPPVATPPTQRSSNQSVPVVLNRSVDEVYEAETVDDEGLHSSHGNGRPQSVLPARQSVYSSVFFATPTEQSNSYAAPSDHVPSVVSSCASAVAGVERPVRDENRGGTDPPSRDSATPKSANAAHPFATRRVTSSSTRSVPNEENEDDFSLRAVSLPPEVSEAVEAEGEHGVGANQGGRYYEYYVPDDEGEEEGRGNREESEEEQSNASSHSQRRGSDREFDQYDDDDGDYRHGGVPESSHLRRSPEESISRSEDMDEESPDHDNGRLSVGSNDDTPSRHASTHAPQRGSQHLDAENFARVPSGTSSHHSHSLSPDKHVFANPTVVVASPVPAVPDVLVFDDIVPVIAPTMEPITSASRFLANLSTESENSLMLQTSATGRSRRRTKIDLPSSS